MLRSRSQPNWCPDSLTTMSDHNEAGQRPTLIDRGEADAQASDGGLHRAGSLQARGSVSR